MLCPQRLEQLGRSRPRAGEGPRQLGRRHRAEAKQQHPGLIKPGIPPQPDKRLPKGGGRALHPHNLAQRLVERLEQIFDDRITPRVFVEVGAKHPPRHNPGAGEGVQPEWRPVDGSEQIDGPAGRTRGGGERIGVDVCRPAQRADNGPNAENRIAWQLVAGENVANGIELGRARLDDRGGRGGFGGEGADRDRSHAPDRAGKLVAARGEGGFEKGEERIALGGDFGADQAFAHRYAAILAVLRPGASKRAQRQTFAHFRGIEGWRGEQGAGERVELAAAEGEGGGVRGEGHDGSDQAIRLAGAESAVKGRVNQIPCLVSYQGVGLRPDFP